MSKEHQISEYTALKLEQSNRILLREAALHINIVITITAFGMLSKGQNEELLPFIVPVVNLVIYWIYHNNDFYINRIRKYIQTIAIKGEDVEERSAYPWEQRYKDKGFSRFTRKIASFAVVATVFFVPSGYYIWTRLPTPYPASIFEIVWCLIPIFYIVAIVGMVRQSSLNRDRWTDE